MLSALLCGVSVMAVWYITLSLLGIKPLRGVIQAVIVGLLCGIHNFILSPVCTSYPMVIMQAGIFLLYGLAVSFFNGNGWEDGLESFFLTQSFFAVYRASIGIKIEETLLCSVIILLIGAQAILLRRNYNEWSCAVSAREASSARRTLILSASLCAVLTVVSVLSASSTMLQRGIVSLLSGMLFSACLWILALADTCEQEAKTVQTEQQYRSEMLSFLNLIRSQRHDYNFHVQTIAGLIRLGKTEECLRYVNALEEDSSLMNAVLPVRDPAISAMIHSFRLQAVRQGIEIHLSIHYDLSQIATTVYETNKIISNLLQNAIDEVAKHEDKSFGIEMSILKRGEYCVIRIANRITGLHSAEQLGDLYRHGYTTKAGHEGVGLTTLRTLTARYHGTIYTQMDGDVIQFVVRIPIDYTKKPYEEQR